MHHQQRVDVHLRPGVTSKGTKINGEDIRGWREGPTKCKQREKGNPFYELHSSWASGEDNIGTREVFLVANRGF